MFENMKFKNDLEIAVLHGDGSRDEYKVSNSICDDFLGGFGMLYYKQWNASTDLQAVIFPSGSQWTGWTWNPRDPWVPYGCQSNAATNTEGSPINQIATITYDAANTRYRLYYQWTKLELDYSLKAVGLTMWDWFNTNECGATANTYGSFPVGTLAVLPTPIALKGLNGGTQVPDILQVSYYLSLVGV